MRQVFYYKMCQDFYSKIEQLLQNATIILQNASVLKVIFHEYYISKKGMPILSDFHTIICP